jgi:hypothetical protein
VSLQSFDSPGIGSFLSGPQWGIFDQNGNPLLTVDSVDSIDYARDYRISDYPQEMGAFESYNKVQVPFQSKIGFLIGPSRAAFLGSIEAATASLDLVTVVTPDIQYPSANLTHYGYRRESRSGVSLIRVDVWCEEVRIIQGSSLSNSQSTNGASPTQSGPTQGLQTSQNAPPASDTSVGGGFSTGGLDMSAAAPSQLPGNVNLVSPPGGILGGASFLPAGIPNSTGGGASSLTTDLEDVSRLTIVPNE